MDSHCVSCGEYLADTSRMICPKCEKPCDTCKMVEDTESCTNYRCKVWRKWFLHKWKQIHNWYKRYGK